jgi:hypothetical protein
MSCMKLRQKEEIITDNSKNNNKNRKSLSCAASWFLDVIKAGDNPVAEMQNQVIGFRIQGTSTECGSN